MNHPQIRRDTWIVSASLSLVLVGGACKDAVRPEESQPVTAASQSKSAASATETLDEEFARLALEVPGGFAGVFLDSAGLVHVALTDTTQRDAALDRLEPTLRLHLNQDYIGSRSAVRVRQVEFTFDELKRWREQIYLAGIPGLVMTDIDEAQNHITLGFTSLALAQTLLDEALVDRGIPARAVVSIIAEEVRTTQRLVDQFSSLPGGVTVTAPGKGACTMAASIRYNGTNAILTAAHCSTTMGHVDPFQWVHVNTLATLGAEIADPASFCPVYSSFYPCRRSDASVVAVNGYTLEIGKLARTTFVGWYPPGSAGSDTISLVKPRFDLIAPGYTVTNPINGSRVNRIGYATGWVSGPVNQTCLDRFDDGWWRLCQFRFNSGTIVGDSGGPVFYSTPCADDPPTLANCATFVGIHWGGNSTQSYFSPMSGVVLDFAGATFAFVP